MNSKVSVIIPVYNAEKNISKCLDSIIRQTYNNLEIICVNDGSKDNSEKIIKEYVNIDKRIKLYSKINSGVSDTRNFGISKAIGDYLMFVDADDFIDNNYINTMLNVAMTHNCDIVVSGYTELKNGIQKEKSIYKSRNQGEFEITFPKELVNNFSTYEFNPCWKQLISKNLLVDNDIVFDSNIKYGEDMLFSFECYSKSKKTYYVKDYGYYYYINSDSVMSRSDINSLTKYYNDNKCTTDIILSKYTATLIEKQALYYKTIKVFNSISSNIILGLNNYHDIKYNILEARRNYNDIFKQYNILKSGNIKEKISFFLLKYRLIYLYYVLKK